MKNIADILSERQSTYGDYTTQAKISQELKSVMRNTKNWSSLSDDKKECLDMIANKIGRILNGDPNFKDSWTDIAGYVTLVERTLKIS